MEVRETASEALSSWPALFVVLASCEVASVEVREVVRQVPKVEVRRGLAVSVARLLPLLGGAVRGEEDPQTRHSICCSDERPYVPVLLLSCVLAKLRQGGEDCRSTTRGASLNPYPL